MEQRLTLIDKTTNPQYAEGSPLLLEACALYLDNVEKQCIAQLKWKNIGNQALQAILIDLVCFDAFGHVVKTQSYQYDRLNVAKGQFCGGKTAIPLGHDKINRYEVVLKAVSYENGTVQEYPALVAYKPLPADKPQELTGDLLAQYKRDLAQQGIKTTVLVNHQTVPALWQCVCGSWQMDGDACCACGADLEKLIAGASPALLEENLSAYQEEMETQRKDHIYDNAKRRMEANKEAAYKEALALLEAIPGWRDADRLIFACQSKLHEIDARKEADRLERERAAEEARIQAEKNARKRKRCRNTFILLVLLAIAGYFTVTEYVIPQQKYDAAMVLKNEGKYSEAIAAFSELEGFRESEEQIAACETAILDGKYDTAMDLMAAGKYEEAIAAFSEIETHKDSAEQIKGLQLAIKNAKYDAAVALLNEGEYLEAYAAFVSLNGHKDSTAQATVAYQQYKMPELKKAFVGSYITFGTYEQDNNASNGKEDIEWLVLAKEKNRLLVISRYALDTKPYNEKYTDVTWETCTLRKWLNSDFLNAAFSSTEKTMIPTVTVSADKNPEYKYNTKPGNATQDKIFLLSIPEANKYFTSDSARQCKPTAYAEKQGAWTKSSGFCEWWLRSPGRSQNCAALVRDDSGVSVHGYYVDYDNDAVRPALWINLSGETNEELSPVSSELAPTTELTAAAEGFDSNVSVTVTLNADGTIATLAIDASGETKGIGTRCAEDEAFISQFIGKTIPVKGVDVLSGATVTSTAVINAVNSLVK